MRAFLELDALLDDVEGGGGAAALEEEEAAAAAAQQRAAQRSKVDAIRSHLRTAAHMTVTEMVARRQIDAIKEGAFFHLLKPRLKGRDEICFVRLVVGEDGGADAMDGNGDLGSSGGGPSGSGVTIVGGPTTGVVVGHRNVEYALFWNVQLSLIRMPSVYLKPC